MKSSLATGDSNEEKGGHHASASDPNGPPPSQPQDENSDDPPPADSNKSTSGSKSDEEMKSSLATEDTLNEPGSQSDGGSSRSPQLGGQHDHDISPPSSIIKSAPRPSKRHTKSNSVPVNFEEPTVMSDDVKSDVICKLMKEDFNDHVLLNVDGTTVTGGDLVKCLEKGGKKGGSDKRMIDAFVQCLKHDDIAKEYNKTRIIIPVQDQIKEVAQGIVKEFQEMETRSEKGKDQTDQAVDDKETRPKNPKGKSTSKKGTKYMNGVIVTFCHSQDHMTTASCGTSTSVVVTAGNCSA